MTENWTPPQGDENPDTPKTDFDLGQEKPPLLRYLVAFLALALVLGGAVWLVSKVVVPKKIPTIGQAGQSTQPVQPKTGTAPPPVKKTPDDEAWVRALEKDTLEGYRAYLTAFPKGHHAQDAQEQINAYDNKAWERAKARATIAGYEDYLKDWPEGLHASKAKEIIKEMKDKAEAARKDAAERAEKAKLEAAARAQREAKAWREAASTNTIAAYENYLKHYPTGKHEAEARARIASLKASAGDKAAWEQAKAANTVNAYQQYLNSFPKGAYIANAIAAIDKLKPAAGKTFRDCADCPVMVSLPTGTVTLGAAQDDTTVRPNEKPARPVTFTNMFAIAVHEISFDDWQKCVGAGACKPISNDNGWGRAKRPVINVSWEDAQNYVDWLSQKTGKSYALPSEAQWEYAARGGDKGQYIGGSQQSLCAFANGAGSESGLKWANPECSDLASDRTLPVGTLSANGFGVRDMIGNVAEWTLDCNTLNLRDAPTDGSADQRGSCNQRIARGGSWFSGPKDLRYTARMVLRRGDRNDFTGFRVVRTIGN